jgi:hypothetical protein
VKGAEAGTECCLDLRKSTDVLRTALLLLLLLLIHLQLGHPDARQP